MDNLSSRFLIKSRNFFNKIHEVEIQGEDDFLFEGVSSNEIIVFLNFLDVIEKKEGITLQKEPPSEYLSTFSTMQLFLLLFLKKNLEHPHYHWLRNAHYGREGVLNFLRDGGIGDTNIFSCMEQSNLTKVQLDEISSAWWRELSELSRSVQKDRNTEIGNKGEDLSFEYERQRINRSPERTYIEQTGAGYDLLSWVDGETDKRACIEVKTSERGKNNSNASFYITKNEWKVANLKEEYIFHFWNVSNINAPELAIVEKSEVLIHIPRNQGEGEWQDVKILLEPFHEMFHRVN